MTISNSQIKSITAIAERAVYLNARWADESEYEDRREYVANLTKAAAEHGLTLKHVSQRFLSFTLKEPKQPALFKVEITLGGRIRVRKIVGMIAGGKSTN